MLVICALLQSLKSNSVEGGWTGQSRNNTWSLVGRLLRFLFLHTLFFFELYFEPYLIGTMISWSLDHILWSYLLIISLDHISWSYLLILSLDHISLSYLIWQMILCFLTFLRHVLDTYFGYYLHALDMCYTRLTHTIHFRCCTSHACSMLYLWLMHVCLTAYMLTLLYKPSIDNCTL